VALATEAMGLVYGSIHARWSFGVADTDDDDDDYDGFINFSRGEHYCLIV
jgi:hypothetical protein